MTEANDILSTHHSHLFTVRLWAEDLGDDQVEWRGEVQHVLTSETRYFRDLTSLGALLEAMLAIYSRSESLARSAEADAGR
jgi:hypothetical protein